MVLRRRFRQNGIDSAWVDRFRMEDIDALLLPLGRLSRSICPSVLYSSVAFKVEAKDRLVSSFCITAPRDVPSTSLLLGAVSSVGPGLACRVARNAGVARLHEHDG